MYTIITRKPTPEEQEVISALAKTDYASFGCAFFTAVFAVWMLGNIGHWIGSFISVDVSKYSQWAGWIGGTALGIPMLLGFFSYCKKQMKLAARDQQEQHVQEIHVTNARVFGIAMIGNIGPNVAIELSEEIILYLQGQWLENNEIYSAPLPEDTDEVEEIINGLPAPHSFPSTDFTITRLPHCGEVLRIKVAGKYLQPEAVVDALKTEFEFQPSELFTGSIDDIAAIMQREYETRVVNKS